MNATGIGPDPHEWRFYPIGCDLISRYDVVHSEMIWSPLQDRPQCAGDHQRDRSAQSDNQPGQRHGQRRSQHIGHPTDQGKREERRGRDHPAPDSIDPAAHLIGGPLGHVRLHGDDRPGVGQAEGEGEHIEHRDRRLQHGRNHDEWTEIPGKEHLSNARFGAPAGWHSALPPPRRSSSTPQASRRGNRPGRRDRGSPGSR